MRFHTVRTNLKHAALLLPLLFSAVAGADANIDVFDGTLTDWPANGTCYTEGPGDASGGIDLNQACLENNNASGGSGYLFVMMQSAQTLPASGDKYFGFAYDRNRDGVINDNDRAWGVLFTGSNTTPTRLDVFTASNFNLVAQYTSTSSCGAAGGTQNGWNARMNAARTAVELQVGYGCLGLSYGTDDMLFLLGAYPNFDLTPQAYYNGTSGTLSTATVPPNVSNLTAVAKNASITVAWTNPAAHEGVLVLRQAGSAPTTAPTRGRFYATGESVGAASVVYSDVASSVSSYTDTGLTNDTRYYYKVFNHHGQATYASGAVPTSSGISIEPTAGTGNKPLWCYATGASRLTQPVTQLGVGIFSPDLNGAVAANLSSAGAGASDGLERWRPAQVGGGTEARFPVVPLGGGSTNYILVGDMNGRGYAFNADTGAQYWTVNTAGNRAFDMGGRIQAQPAVQLRQYSNAAYQAQYSHDLVFFATRNDSNTTNKVYAVNGSTGRVVWTFPPTNNMGDVNGGMLVDYETNRLWVTTRGSNEIRVVNILTGSQLTSIAPGDIDHGPTLDFQSGQVLVVTTGGNVRSYDRTTYALGVNLNLGAATTSYVFPTGRGFIASVGGASGRVAYYTFSGSTTTLLWQRSIANPSGVTIHYGSQRLYVGSSDGTVKELDILNTGTILRSVQVVPTGAVGTPTIDKSTNRLHVGSVEKVCAFTVPFP